MSPQRVFLAVALPVGVFVALLLPSWTGYDEFAHYSRAVDIAGGSFFPVQNDQDTGSLIPAAYAEGTDLVILNYQAGNNPTNWAHVTGLMKLRPDGRMIFVDTRATSASTPMAYLPAAAGMYLPVMLDAPGIVVLWAGRLFSLAAYVGLAYLAIRSAKRFRWTLAIAGLLPLNLTLAASISPDGLTIAALLMTVAIWTRVEEGDETPLGWMACAFLLLALAKPPYFLVLALFPALLLGGRTRARLHSALLATASLTIGICSALINSSENYRAVTFSLIGSSKFQPDIQFERLLNDLPDFVLTSASTWFRELNDYIPEWFRQLGSWESALPAGVGWLFLIAMILAAVRLDAADYLITRGLSRSLVGVGVGGMLLVLYGSSYIYFSDRTDYVGIGIQMARYSVPLAVLGFIGWIPRWLVYRFRLNRPGGRAGAISLVVTAVGVSLALSVVTWLATGDEIPFG